VWAASIGTTDCKTVLKEQAEGKATSWSAHFGLLPPAGPQWSWQVHGAAPDARWVQSEEPASTTTSVCVYSCSCPPSLQSLSPQSPHMLSCRHLHTPTSYLRLLKDSLIIKLCQSTSWFLTPPQACWNQALGVWRCVERMWSRIRSRPRGSPASAHRCVQVCVCAFVCVCVCVCTCM